MTTPTMLAATPAPTLDALLSRDPATATGRCRWCKGPLSESAPYGVLCSEDCARERHGAHP